MIARYAFVAKGTLACKIENILSKSRIYPLTVTIIRTYFPNVLQVRVWFARLRHSTPPREGWFSAR